MATLGAFFAGFGDGDTVLAVALSTVGRLALPLLIARGVQGRGGDQPDRHRLQDHPDPGLHRSCCSSTSTPDVFADNWTAYGYGDLGDLNEQVRNTMLITTFVFIGIEGASVYSRYAKRREDVGRATVLGFLSVLSIFASVTICQLRGPAAARDRRHSGSPRWSASSRRRSATGARSSSASAVIVSVLGAYLAWTLMAAEVMFVAGQGRRHAPSSSAGRTPTDVPITGAGGDLARCVQVAAGAHAVRPTTRSTSCST